MNSNRLVSLIENGLALDLPPTPPEGDSVGFPVFIPLDDLNEIDEFTPEDYIDMANDFARDQLNDCGLSEVQVLSVAFDEIDGSTPSDAQAIYTAVVSGISQDELNAAINEDW